MMASLLAIAGLVALLCVQSAEGRRGRYNCYLTRSDGSRLDDSTKNCEECVLQCINDKSCAAMEFNDEAAVTRANLNPDDLTASCETPLEPQPCPPSSAEQGQALWASLHSLVSSTPAVLTADQSTAVEALIESVKTLYPEVYADVDAIGYWDGMPVGALSRAEYANYLCEVHNKYNVALQKEEFNCAAATIRWNVADGDPENCIPSTR